MFRIFAFEFVQHEGDNAIAQCHEGTIDGMGDGFAAVGQVGGFHWFSSGRLPG